jgi:hypothetical protein
MTRWHLLRDGRIVRTAWSSNGDCATRELRPTNLDLIVSDADWWAMAHRRALRSIPLTWSPLRAETDEFTRRRVLSRVSV